MSAEKSKTSSEWKQSPTFPFYALFLKPFANYWLPQVLTVFKVNLVNAGDQGKHRRLRQHRRVRPEGKIHANTPLSGLHFSLARSQDALMKPRSRVLRVKKESKERKE